MEVIKIENYECLGDSLGKINYNFLEISNNIQLLSSLFFDIDGLFSTINSLSADINKFNNIGNAYNQAIPEKTTTSAVKNLSAYWGKLEITIQYPLNFSTDNYQKLQIFALEKTPNLILMLTNLSKTYLDKNFPATFYKAGDIINIEFLIYNDVGGFTPKISKPRQIYPASQIWDVEYSKKDVYISKSETFKFENQKNSWVFIKRL